MDFVPGPDNDRQAVRRRDLKITGTSWENYSRFDPEAGGVIAPTSTLIFRAGGANAPATSGFGTCSTKWRRRSNGAATLGNTSVGGSTHTLGGNYLEVSGPFNLGSSSPVVKLTGYLTGGGSPTKIRAVIYADNGGQPGALVPVSAEDDRRRPAGARVDFAVTGSPTLRRVSTGWAIWSSNTKRSATTRPSRTAAGTAATYSSLNFRRPTSARLRRLDQLLALRDAGYASVPDSGARCGDVRVAFHGWLDQRSAGVDEDRFVRRGGCVRGGIPERGRFLLRFAGAAGLERGHQRHVRRPDVRVPGRVCGRRVDG